jgi:hypothetical protein
MQKSSVDYVFKENRNIGALQVLGIPALGPEEQTHPFPYVFDKGTSSNQAERRIKL